ncbi:MAG: hypothetical protein BWY06_02812 [Candidatus Latescibacteria bacterium ADurb.Bin168]|nr:MAG: hypothetical protein BWY06_02812 [Candidatus Latescibacteria bacterium ADurb.Bin168]
MLRSRRRSTVPYPLGGQRNRVMEFFYLLVTDALCFLNVSLPCLHLVIGELAAYVSRPWLADVLAPVAEPPCRYPVSKDDIPACLVFLLPGPESMDLPVEKDLFRRFKPCVCYGLYQLLLWRVYSWRRCYPWSIENVC